MGIGYSGDRRLLKSRTFLRTSYQGSCVTGGWRTAKLRSEVQVHPVLPSHDEHIAMDSFSKLLTKGKLFCAQFLLKRVGHVAFGIGHEQTAF